LEYSFLKHKITGAIEADDEFWRSLEEGSFKLPQCSSCAAWTWPAHFRCGRCGSWEFNWVSVAPEGTIFTWTRTHYAFDRVLERKSQVPYVTIVAELPQAGGVRVMGLLKGSEPELRIGMPVRGSIAPPSAVSKWYPSILWEVVR
jgi:uncharacterized protein